MKFAAGANVKLPSLLSVRSPDARLTVVPAGYVRDVVERVTPSILHGRREGLSRVDEFEARHVSETAAQLQERSSAIADRIATGTLAIAGVTYHLADGQIQLRDHLGDIGEV